jgi:uncharacterized membrane protein YgdD (TMEM256/DUF423 family)
MVRFLWICGALHSFLAVGLGALGKHGVRTHYDERAFEIFQTAGEYQMSHGLGLILIALLLKQYPKSTLLPWAGRLMFVGVTLFSGSLYLLAVTDFSPIAWITPMGGTILLGAWLTLIWAGIKTED